uniref:Small ribosomal subunit protein bS18c n=1 Tax=Erodium texanum TaxID=28960 RepID=E2FET8_EROTE|nr:ribosomal protein S18 [Erodium texanum]ADJ66293.1 ribosomal protein S18 [Erodium texanum]
MKPKLQKKKRPFLKKKRSFRRRLPPITPEELLNYKNVSVISQFISKQGKILPRWVKGLKKKKQDLVKRAVKQARLLALLYFQASEKLFHVSEIRIEKKSSSSPKNTKLGEQEKRKPRNRHRLQIPRSGVGGNGGPGTAASILTKSGKRRGKRSSDSFLESKCKSELGGVGKKKVH